MGLKILTDKIHLVDQILVLANFEKNRITNDTGTCYKKGDMIVNVFDTGSINFQGKINEEIKTQIIDLVNKCNITKQ